MMHTYELLFILESDKEETQKKIAEYIQGVEGTIRTSDKWGRKNFAYPIKKKSSGYYFIWKIMLDQKKTPYFKKKIDTDEGILRYLLIKLKVKS